MSSWIGAARPLTDEDFARAAGFLNVDEAAVRAVVEVEAASYGFDEKRRPRILFEPHIFWRQLGPGIKRNEAREYGLAYPRWRRNYPRTMDARYAQLDRACQIDRAAAIKSASWGLGQVMGFNYKAAGFASIEAFVEAMKESEGEHLMAMAMFIKTNRLDDEMRARDWAAFARRYNGPGYAKNNYDTRLANAHARFSGKGGVASAPLLRKGASGDAVRRAQMRLNAHGFGLRVDGAFGEQTYLAVVAFQERKGLLADGVIGKATWAALAAQPDARTPDPDEAIPAPADVEHEPEKTAPAKEAAKTPEGKGGIATGVGGIGAVLTETAQQVQPLMPYAEVMKYVFLALMLAGIGFTTYALIKREREK